MIVRLELTGGQMRRVTADYADLAAAAADEPGGAGYLVARTYRRGATLALEEHIARMERSAVALAGGRPSDGAPREAIRAAIAAARTAGGWDDVRVRVTMIAGRPPELTLSAEEAREVPLELRDRGCRCALAADAARHDPTVKTTDWMRARRALATGAAEAAYETLLVDRDGAILEGASSTFWAVVDGTLHTAGAGVLEGIARRAILEFAPRTVPVRLDPVMRGDLRRVSECFISSATRGIVPVARIDGEWEGRAPGPVTRALIDAWDEWLDRHLEAPEG